jgi:hypothetical protein
VASHDGEPAPRRELNGLLPDDVSVLASEIAAEGFDARGTVPPFVRPGVVFDRASWRAWDSFLVEACNRAEAPEIVLARMARGAEALRVWTPGKGDLLRYASDVLGRALGEPREGGRSALAWADATRLHGLVAACVRPGLPMPPPPDAVEPAGAGRAWSDGARVARRYLAARAFGAWSAYLGDGVRTQVAVLAATLAVLRAEFERVARESPAPTRDLWLRAVSSADRLLLHHVDDAALCRRFGNVETMPAVAFTRVLGVRGA